MRNTRRIIHHNQLKNTGTEPWPSRESKSHQRPQYVTTLELSVIECDCGSQTTEEEELLQGDDDLMDEDPVATTCTPPTGMDARL